jgi:RNase P subunit RPR2
VLLKRTICTEADVAFKRVNAGRISTERRFEYDGAECPACGASYRPETYQGLASYHGEKHCSDCQSILVPGASEQERLREATRRLRRTAIVWDDRRCAPAELATRVREVQERAEAGKLVARDGTVFPKGKVRAVMVDYLQKLPAPPGATNRSLQLEVADVSMGLVENVAKGCDVAVIALAQINRLVDKQKDARPTLADIREAGDIEQDADEIIAIHREQYRLREKTPVEYQNIAEFIHLKGRGGLDAELPPARMWFVAGKFHSLPPDERACARHAPMLVESRGDPRSWAAVAYESSLCVDCYRGSWDAWAERVGVKR